MRWVNLGLHQTRSDHGPYCDKQCCPIWPIGDWTLFFFKIIFGRHQFFLCGHWYPCFGFQVTSALGFKTRVDFIACMLVACAQWIPQIYLWCDTCWPLGSQHGIWAISIYILVSRHGWGFSPHFIFGSIDGRLVFRCLTLYDKTGVPLTELCFLNSNMCKCPFFRKSAQVQ